MTNVKLNFFLMASLNSVDISNWFDATKKTTKIKLPGLATGGRGVETRNEEYEKEKDLFTHVPSYKWTECQDQFRYAEEYKRAMEDAEEKELDVSSRFAGTVSTFETPEDVTTIAESLSLADLNNSDDVYDRYDFRHEYNKDLPIYASKDEIMSKLTAYPVIVINGPTGCGKTTQVPQYILNHSRMQNKHCNIVVTQPRKIAAKSIAERVCVERRWEVGGIVGYQVSLDKEHKSADTRLLYVTTGVLIKKLINKQSLSDFTHIILDEVHERDKDTDFLLILVKKLLQTNSRNVKVIVMSATIDTELFASYFSMGRLSSEACVIKIEQRQLYPIHDFYLDDLSKAGKICPEVNVNEPTIDENLYQLVRDLIEDFDKLDEQKRGSVLVFLPGIEYIHNMRDTLCANTGLLTHKWNLLQLHSTITIEEQKHVFDRPSPGYRKIILSTNIAESSITLTDICYVIDFCLTKQIVWDKDTNLEYLQLTWASKVNCRQRMGRVGRVRSGRVYRLVPKSFYDNYLPGESVPEMQRCPLERLVLNIKKFGMGSSKEMLAEALSPPPLCDIERTVLILKEVGALTSSGRLDPYDGEMTFLGHVMETLPLDIRVSKMIVFGHLFGCLEDCIIIGAGMSVKNIFSQPFGMELDSYKSKVTWDMGAQSDCLTILSAYNTWKTKKREQYFVRPGNEKESHWAKTGMLQLLSLNEMSRLIEEIQILLNRLGIFVPKAQEMTERQRTEKDIILKVIIAAAFYPNYYMRQPIDEAAATKMLSGHDPFNTVILHGLPDNVSFVYGDEVRQMFEKKRFKVDKIAFENTRAYVTFKRLGSGEKNILGKINPAVIGALKMRTVRDSRKDMVLEAMSKHNAWKKLKTLRENQPCSNSQNMVLKPVDLPTSKEFVVDILEFVDAATFWARNLDSHDSLRWVHHMIEEYSDEMEPLNGIPTIGSMVLAPYDMSEGTYYYRARVDEVEGKTAIQQGYNTEVFFLDYGGRKTLDSQRLFSVKNKLSCLYNIPPLIFRCTLNGIKPNTITCRNGLWSKEATDFSKRMVTDVYRRKGTIRGLVYSKVHNEVHLELHLEKPSLDSFRPNQVFSLNVLLLENRFAERAGESYISKQKHEILEQCDFKEEASQYLGRNLVPDNFEPTADIMSRRPRTTLRGPFSPLELKFSAVTYGNRHLAVTIDRDSVNSVILEDEPQVQRDRILVGCSVSTNACGSKLNLRSSTMMPNIAGLPALLCLIFCPKAELRRNLAKTCYTGALCGLGTSHNSNYSLFLDNDLEMEFDVYFSQADIQSINSIRCRMNNILKAATDDHPRMTSANLTQNQKILRDTMIKLLNKKRMDIDQVEYPNKYQWQRVNPLDVDQPGEWEEESGNQVFPQHDLLKLEMNPFVSHLIWLYHNENNPGLFDPREGITCELCFFTAMTLQSLHEHLNTTEHKRKEKRALSTKQQRPRC